jgi:hypothetical protein
MAVLYLDADVPALLRLVRLMEAFWEGDFSAPVLAEIRQLEDRLGLSPLARRRLQFEIDLTNRVLGRDGSGDVALPDAEDERWLRAVDG